MQEKSDVFWSFSFRSNSEKSGKSKLEYLFSQYKSVQITIGQPLFV